MTIRLEPSTGTDPLRWLRDHAVVRTAAGLRRRLVPRPASGEAVLDLAGNDYLGLARDARVVAAAADAARAWGAGSTGSRLVTGSTELHAELERELAAFCGTEVGLVFSSGYLANVGTVTALAGSGDLVVSDAHNHASIVDGCRLSRARVVVAPHRDVAAVETALAERREPRALVVTDAVFSVDGDVAPLAELAAACRRHGALLVVDDAHALGVVGPEGRGAVHAAGLAGAEDVVVTTTLSKSLGSQGGAVLAGRDVVDHLVDTARGFIFETALAPPATAAALAALRVLADSPELATAVRTNAAAIAGIVGSSARPAAAVVSVPVGAAEAAVRAAEACARSGVRVGCFRPPSVPDGTSRLRLTARADLCPADLARLRTAIAAARESR